MKQISTKPAWLVSLFVVCVLQWKSTTAQSYMRRYPGMPMSGQQYLHKYGYLCQKSDVRNYNVRRTAVMKFQEFYNIPMTGRIDSDTRRMMSKARCGVKDFQPKMIDGRLTFGKMRRRQKRYASTGHRWRKKALTYYISSPYRPSNKLNRKQVKKVIKKSFAAWAKFSTLTFTEVYNNKDADIVFKFVSAWHNDYYPFDGPGGTFGHAFPPSEANLEDGLAGEIHFDDDELLVLGRRDGGAVDFYWLAVHEIGHVIGLDHSDKHEAAMYSMSKVFSKLHADDIKGITMLYDKPNSGPINSRNPYSSQSSVCRQKSFDAVVYETENSVTYFFKGKYFWKRDARGVVSHSKLIRYWWKSLENDIDTAYTRLDGRIMFFKGSKYWLFNGIELEVSGNLDDRNIPLELSGMNAAMVWGRDGMTYFFKRGKVWRYNQRYWIIDDGYTKQAAQSWGQHFVDLDVAVTWANGKTYIFKGTGFYEYDDESGHVKSSIPQNTLEIWLGC